MGLFGRKRRGAGVRGTARVVSCSRAPQASHAPLHMNVVVEAPGIPAYSHEYRKFGVRVDKWPQPGEVLPVEVDPADPRSVEVLWDELPTTRDAAKQQAERMAAMLRQQPQGQPALEGMAGMVEQMFPGAVVSTGGEAPPPMRVVAGQSDGDPVERLAKLAQLRDAGIIDDTQFEQLKAQILDQAGLDDS